MRFDRLARSLSSVASRRGVLAGLFAVLGLEASRVPVAVDAKKKASKKLKRNSFGCVDVGKACRGNDANCCSGLCQGKKPKKGAKDKSRCVGHNSANCTLQTNSCEIGEDVVCGPGDGGNCLVTTGNAPFCGDITDPPITELCRDCRRDADCQEEFGPGAACIALVAFCGPNCPPAEGPSTACVPPGD